MGNILSTIHLTKLTAIATLAMLLLSATNVHAQASALQLNTMYRKCGTEAFLVKSSCLSARALKRQCDSASGVARWNKSAFYCRGSIGNRTASASRSTITNTTRKSGFSALSYKAPVAAVSQNGASAKSDYVNRICSKSSSNAQSRIVRGEICRFKNGKRVSAPIGTYRFDIKQGRTNAATIACIKQRVKSITRSTITHHKGKKIQASKNYNFCNISGILALNGTF
ncbi:MAG: hypothetical protein ACPGVN_05725 [Alphaproteobacteria bacterium]